MSGLVGAYHGYQYQDILAACVLADGVSRGLESAAVDKKLVVDDRFDDLTVVHAGLRRRIQVKSHMAETRCLEISDFTSNRINMRIDRLVATFMLDSPPAEEYRLIATYAEPTDPELSTYYTLASDTEPLLPHTQTYRYRLRPESIWPVEEPPRWNALALYHTDRTAFVEFCQRFLIELRAPPMSQDLRSPGPLESCLLDVLQRDVGVGLWPNQAISPPDAAASLIFRAGTARSRGETLVSADVIRALNLRTDYGRLTQVLPIDPMLRINRSAAEDALRTQAGTAGRRAVIGPPGAGKSWTLAHLVERARADGFLVATHYCYLEPGDEEMARRAEITTMFGNLVAELMDGDPSLAGHGVPRFSAGASELEQRVARAAERQPHRRILLVVDGLDHVDRVNTQSDGRPTRGSRDLTDELASLDLPPQACLVVGSQPGPHLDDLLTEAQAWELPPWQREDIRSLADLLGLTESVLRNGDEPELEAVIDAIAAKCDGNALYATYCCHEALRITNGDRVTDEEQMGDSAPITQRLDLGGQIRALPPFDAKLEGYYGWLLDNSQATTNAPWLAELLAVVEFSVSRDDLREIRPSERHRVEPGLRRLAPVLREHPQQGGVRIYHESFQRFIVRRLRDQGVDLADVLEPVHEWLDAHGFLRDARSFRFLLPTLARAGHGEEVLRRVGPEFVPESVAWGHSAAAILSNLSVAAREAADRLDWPVLARLVEAARSVRTCFDDKLSDEVAMLWGSVLIELRAAEHLAERLLFDGRPTFRPRTGLLLCELCDKAGVPAPWRQYLRAHDSELRTSRVSYGEESDALVARARVRGYLRTHPPDDAAGVIVPWLTDHAEVNPNHAADIVAALADVYGPEPLAPIIDSLPRGLARALCRREAARRMQASGDHAAATREVRLAVAEGAPPELYWELVTIAGVLPGMATDVSALVEMTRRASGKEAAFEQGLVPQWFGLVLTAAVISPEALPAVEEAIAGDGWYHEWMRFVVILARLRARQDSSIAEALSLLQQLTINADPFKGEPRACDLWLVRQTIHESIGQALSLVSDDAWPKALAILDRVSRETSTTLENQPSGPLTFEALLDSCRTHATTPARLEAAKDYAIDRLSGEQSPTDFYESHAIYEMTLCRFEVASGNTNAALEHWRRAAVYLTAYGFRKDITIYELIEPLPSIARHDVPRARQMLRALQDLVQAVIVHTDGKDTRHAKDQWYDTLADIDPSGAALIFARELARDGGRVLHHIELAIPTLLAAPGVIAGADPFLAVCLWLTVVDTAKHREAMSRAVERLLALDQSLGEVAQPVIDAAIERDIPAEAEGLPPYAPGAEAGLDPPVAAVPGGVRGRSSAGAFHQAATLPESIQRRPLFGVDDSPLRIVQGLRRWPSGLTDGLMGTTAAVNAIGWRLVELAERDQEDVAVRLLYHVAEEGRFRGGDVVLYDLAVGLARHGFRALAVTAYSLAFTRARRGGGWLAFGGRERYAAISAALAIDEPRTLNNLAGEAAHAVANGGPEGASSGLIELFCAIGRVDDAIRMWEAARDIIAARLPRNGPADEVEELYSVALATTVTIDDALITLLLARLCHPSLTRRRSAAAGIALVTARRAESLAARVADFIRQDAPITTVLVMLQALLSFEPAPFTASRGLEPILHDLTASDVLGFRVLAIRLLRRIKIAPTLAPKTAAAEPLARSLDTWGQQVWEAFGRGREDAVAQAVPSGEAMVASQFRRAFESEGVKRRLRSHMRVSHDRTRPDLLPEIWSPLEELFESALHTVMSSAWASAKGANEYTSSEADKGVSAILDDLDIAVRYELARTPRPEGPVPEDVSTRTSPVEPIASGVWVGWYRIGYAEIQLRLGPQRDRTPIEKIIGFGGMILPGMATDGPPLGNGSAELWRGNSREGDAPSRLLGPVSGLDIVHHWLGRLYVLCPPPALLALHRLSPPLEPRPLSLVDTTGKPGVVLRHWRTSPIGGRELTGEIPQLVGSDLLVRADLFQDLVARALGQPYFEWWSQRYD